MKIRQGQYTDYRVDHKFYHAHPLAQNNYSVYTDDIQWAKGALRKHDGKTCTSILWGLDAYTEEWVKLYRRDCWISVTTCCYHERRK